MAVQAIADQRMSIDGQPCEAPGDEWAEVYDPATNEVIARVPAATRADVDRAVAAARAASVWTHDVFKAMRAARTLNFGAVWVNDHLPLASEMPHGGFRQSGSGKDMSSCSFEEYTQVKHVMVELSGEAEKGWHHTVFGDAKG